MAKYKNNRGDASDWVDPFLSRINSIIVSWVESEWSIKESIRLEALSHGWTEDRLRRFKDANLTAVHLANRVDGISDTKLRRELERLGAPTPGELIRKARLQHAAKLLTHTRLLIKEVGKRSGYRSEKHFSEAFRAEFETSPSEYRRDFITRNNLNCPPT